MHNQRREVRHGPTATEFHAEFKQEADDWCRRSGKSECQVARELGIPQPTFNRWMRQVATAPLGAKSFLATEELKVLRREVEQLRMERGPESGPVAAMETGAVVERDRSGTRQACRIDSWRGVIERGGHSSRSHAVALGTDAGRSRRNFAWDSERRVLQSDRSPPRSGERRRPSAEKSAAMVGPHTYRAAEADVQAWTHTRRPKPCRLATSLLLQQIVASKLALQWSPEQIAGWLTRAFPDQDTMRISHETIYRSLFIQARGVLKKELIGYLRSRRKMRRVKPRARLASRAGRLLMASPSATVPLTWKIGRFPVIGKGT